MKTLVSIALLVAGLFVAAPAAQAAERNPIIFVHGYGGSASDLNMMKSGLVAAGYDADRLFSLDFPNTQKNQTTAAQLATFVDEVRESTGSDKVDLIGFSMGSLSSRYHLKNLGGTADVGHFLSIAGPNHGTFYANFCLFTGDLTVCPQMAPSSSFLTALNKDDETPGDVAYATIVSSCDDIISPYSSTKLSGADNRTTTACLAHNKTPGSAEVISFTASFFAP